MKQKEWYAYQEKIHVAVDCIIFGFSESKIKVLAFQRNVQPLKGEWSLIGSFVRSDEPVETAAHRVLYELTGLRNVFLQELKSYSAIDRDPGQRCISIAHYALINAERNQDVVAAHNAYWFSIEDLPTLTLDHDIMTRDALRALKREARYQPIGFELLPERFTIPQLQLLYEAIYGRKLDSRNFRKKLLSFDVLIKTNQKDYSTSKKGAYLYRFDEKKYQEFLTTGYDFTL